MIDSRRGQAVPSRGPDESSLFAGLDVGVLGPVAVRGRDGVALLSNRPAVVLVALVERYPRTASIVHLERQLWNELPATSRTMVHMAVVELRKILGSTKGAVSVVTSGSAYRLEMRQDSVDYLQFKWYVELGRRQLARGDYALSRRNFAEAMSLWRTDSGLSNLPTGSLEFNATISRLADEAFEVRLLKAESAVRSGKLHEGIIELQELRSEFPCREEVASRLMLSLVECGRTAEAIQVYNEVGLLVERALGVTVGLRLRRLHARIRQGRCRGLSDTRPCSL